MLTDLEIMKISTGPDEECLVNLLKACGGFYACPKDLDGKRLGPLVGYAGRDETGRQYVGEVYLNCAKAEEQPRVLELCAKRLSRELLMRRLAINPNVLLGAPEGGKSLALLTALKSERRFIYPEKRVTALATPQSRELTKMVFARHEVGPDDQVMIIEDVLNNFTTTAELIFEVEKFGARVVAIAGILNRSNTFDELFPYQGRTIPVVSLVRMQILQYRQDHPAVADDIAAGNVVWKPKHEWARLAEAMLRAPT